MSGKKESKTRCQSSENLEIRCRRTVESQTSVFKIFATSHEQFTGSQELIFRQIPKSSKHVRKLKTPIYRNKNACGEHISFNRDGTKKREKPL